MMAALITIRRQKSFIILPIFSFLSCLFALIAFFIDVATFVPARHKLMSAEGTAILGLEVTSTSLGPAFWLSLATFCVDIFGWVILLFHVIVSSSSRSFFIFSLPFAVIHSSSLDTASGDTNAFRKHKEDLEHTLQIWKARATCPDEDLLHEILWHRSMRWPLLEVEVEEVKMMTVWVKRMVCQWKHLKADHPHHTPVQDSVKIADPLLGSVKNADRLEVNPITKMQVWMED